MLRESTGEKQKVGEDDDKYVIAKKKNGARRDAVFRPDWGKGHGKEKEDLWGKAAG